MRTTKSPFPEPELGVRAIRSGRVVLGSPVRLDEVGKAGDVGTSAHYADAACYGKTYAERTEDIAYYVGLARRVGGPVLEYGVGAGRIAIPLARTGVSVVGVDLSRAMLRELDVHLRREPEDVRRRVTWHCGDMREVRLRKRFTLVVAGFNTLLHLYEREDVEAFFSRVREHLAPRGRFAFDFAVPRVAELATAADQAWGGPPIHHPTAGERTRYRERFEYDPLRQVLLTSLDYAPVRGDAWTVPLAQRQFFPREMEALLHYNGFDQIEWTADFTGQAPTEDVDSMVVVCKARRRDARRSKRR